MAYPPQGIDKDVLRRSKISQDTWELLLAANNPAKLVTLLRRVLRSEEDQED